MPNGSFELIINFGDKQSVLEKRNFLVQETYKDFWIAGFQHKPIIIQSSSDTNLLGIRFLPGGAYPFFKIPINEFSDKIIEADWLTLELERLRDALACAKNFAQMISVVETFLGKKINNNHFPNEAVNYVISKINSSADSVSIKHLVNKTGY